ncbi:MAG: sugar phosphate isomerase/epimerase [Anaerolineales bacterium]|nr:sugar phosphate isomerase/epimerase [Anaerolineales bacterium]
MNQWKFCANASFFGLRRDRFNQYQPERSLEEKFALAAQVEGMTGIELKYPKDFKDLALVKTMLEKCGLALSAVNVDIKDVTYFRYGSFSARDPEARGRAVSLAREGMDMAAEMGADLVTTCPAVDAYDYPFQIDYVEAWDNFISAVRAAASHRADVNLALEYQPNDPHAKILLSNVGKALHVCAEVSLPNLGVNLDVGHSFAAGEAPAEAAALLARKGLLRYLHSNDNTGDGGDWDMISGSVHFWHWLELLYTLERVGYQGWIGADITCKHFDPVEAFRANTCMIQRMSALLERIGPQKIAEMIQQQGKTAELYIYMSSFL